ncbi:MAG TPA: GAF domain-containing protein, partial [Kofleriaceae bacterium]
MRHLDFRGLADTAADVITVLDREQRYVYANTALERATGMPAASVVGKRNAELMAPEDAAVWGEALDEVLRTGRERTLECTLATPRGPRRFASVITRAPGDLLLVTTRDVTEIVEARRAQEAAHYLAEASALLERFVPDTSPQAIVDLAVPVLADWCFIHMKTDGEPAVVAIAHADPAKVAAVWARVAEARPLSADTAIARVLAGGPREIVDIDSTVLAQAAWSPAHFEQLRHDGYCSAVVAPLSGRDGVLGAVTFAMAESGRRYIEADLDILAELARRTGIALDNARLFAAEQEARRHAEEARDRTRWLQLLTATLSSAVEQRQVVSIMVDAGRGALGDAAGFAWLLRDENTLELAGAAHGGLVGRLEDYRIIPMTAPLPVCDVIRSARPMMFENLAAIAACYPASALRADAPYQAWAVIPFVVAGRAVGAVAFAFVEERAFSDDDRELLAAMIGQASLAIERCMLLEAARRARDDA